jgi:asparagine synthase (glutamine-hydrolysing)
MSGIAGIINLDGAPVDGELLERMTGAMKARAPDENNIWVSGNVGFGHAMLRISPESKHEHQPCTLDGQVSITADARIDGRVELIAKLRSAGCEVRQDAPDVEVILHAYSAFSESFLEHLIGDFAFALWDNRRKKLICARDHFGVRPFFYVKTDKIFLFASDLDALLNHTSVSRELDEEAIGDFLLFGSRQDPEASTYRNIRRLKAASRIGITQEGFCIRQYWAFSLHNEILYRSNSEYVEQFQALFRQSVEDRMGGDHIALELSGGMDSTSIAALAAANAKTTGRMLSAYTITCHDLLPDDQEGYFAGMAASFMKLPLVYQSKGDYALFERLDAPQFRSAEPLANPDWAMGYDNYEAVTRRGARVLLSGQGGDAVFGGSGDYYLELLRRGRLSKFLVEAARHVINTRSLAGMGLRPALIGSKPWQPAFPEWIDKAFCERAKLEDRWKAGWAELNSPGDTCHQLNKPWLSQMFEGYESLKMPLVVRHPFFDVRLATFLLGLPNYVKHNKKPLREAMRGRLPEPVRTRPKTALVGDHFRARFSGGQWQARMISNLANHGDPYVDHSRYMRAFEKYLGGAGVESTWSSWLMIVPLMLNIWLAGAKQTDGRERNDYCQR